MELLRNANFDFMKYRRFWITVSVLTILVGIFGLTVHGQLNVGVDFAGGTQLTLKFAEAADVQVLRDVIASAGVKEAVIQRFGDVGDNEVLIRTPILAGSEEGSGAVVSAALHDRFNPGATGMDLNLVGTGTIAERLASLNPDGVSGEAANILAHYETVAGAIMAKRKVQGMFGSWDDVAGEAGVSPGVLEALKREATIGKFSVLSVENVGPQVGAELRRRGLLAVVGALAGMLIYIWVRFELRFGVGATMATLHDVLVTLGLFYWAGYEFNLTTVAGFLTLIGYSVNDTVVTFDRVRENLRKSRTQPLIQVLNRSINQTLSRTLLTGGTTILASGTLYLFGGDVIRGFAFIMTVGVVVGTYSSMYIASPFALLWEQWFGAQGSLRRK